MQLGNLIAHPMSDLETGTMKPGVRPLKAEIKQWIEQDIKLTWSRVSIYLPSGAHHPEGEWDGCEIKFSQQSAPNNSAGR